MSCVGYQSRLFPVCVNCLLHRPCLGYTPPRGGCLLKMTGLWWETVDVFLWACYQPTVCTGHTVVPQCNLLMSAFLHSVLTFNPSPAFLQSLVRKSENSFALLIGVDAEVVSNQRFGLASRAEEQETWRGTHPSCPSTAVHHFLLTLACWSRVLFHFSFGCCQFCVNVLCRKSAKDGVWTVGTVYARDGINLRREAWQLIETSWTIRLSGFTRRLWRRRWKRSAGQRRSWGCRVTSLNPAAPNKYTTPLNDTSDDRCIE